MARINENYLKLPGAYLFSEVGKRAAAFQKENPDAKIIRLGIGDVTRPLPQVCIDAMKRAADEMGHVETFRGYGPEQGYSFLRDKIVDFNYKRRGLDVSADEIFISDGSKCDCGNIQEIFSLDCKIAIGDPVYPVYNDSNVMAGRTGKLLPDGHFEGIVYLPCTAENNFSPKPPAEKVDMVYLCSPNNPTGTTLDKATLEAWVAYAKENDAVILFDAAYAAYITDDTPRSIYEIEGARDVAIEFRSFSKTAGFTGTRCGYIVIPNGLTGTTSTGERVPLKNLWARRHTTKFNGTSYITQRGAEAIYSDEGQAQIKELINYYLENARIIRESLSAAGLTTYGGINAPYIWLKTPDNIPSSWDFFDVLLRKHHIIGTPGAGFGPCGEGYLRLTSFNSRENTIEACERLKKF